MSGRRPATRAGAISARRRAPSTRAAEGVERAAGRSSARRHRATSNSRKPSPSRTMRLSRGPSPSRRRRAPRCRSGRPSPPSRGARRPRRSLRRGSGSAAAAAASQRRDEPLGRSGRIDRTMRAVGGPRAPAVRRARTLRGASWPRPDWSSASRPASWRLTATAIRCCWAPSWRSPSILTALRRPPRARRAVTRGAPRPRGVAPPSRTECVKDLVHRWRSREGLSRGSYCGPGGQRHQTGC